jgi:hypothetical protein
MNRMRTILIVSALALSACSSGETSDPVTAGAADAAAQPAGYPEGPYGSEVGQTVTNFSFQALAAPEFDASKARTIKVGDFYDPNGAAGRKLLVFGVCSVWCALCPPEWERLPAKVSEYASKGVSFVGVLFENSDVKPISAEEAGKWAKESGASFSVAIDPQYQMSGFIRPVEVPAYVIVSARDMKVLGIIKIAPNTPRDASPVWTFVDQKLAEIH